MRYFLFIFIALIGFSPITSADQPQDKPFAVVELFSSEGCSSCPPADFLVSQLTAWARKNNEPVYPLIFHVDYWNDLGWQDVFSKNEFTQRQSNYARILNDRQIYTPEMIVNGTDAFVGSDQQRLQKDLDHELTVPASVILHVSFIKQGDHISVKYKSEGFSDGAVVNFALVERGLITDVTAGENAGRMLRHDNVVREFQTIRLKEAEAQIIMPLKNIADTSQASLIVYVQDPETMLIEAAKQLDLKK